MRNSVLGMRVCDPLRCSFVETGKARTGTSLTIRKFNIALEPMIMALKHLINNALSRATRGGDVVPLESHNSPHYTPRVSIVSNTHIVLENQMGTSGGRWRVGWAVCCAIQSSVYRFLSTSMLLYSVHLLATIKNISGHFPKGGHGETSLNDPKCQPKRIEEQAAPKRCRS